MKSRSWLFAGWALVFAGEIAGLAWLRHERRQLEGALALASERSATQRLAAAEERSGQLEREVRLIQASPENKAHRGPRPGSFADRYGKALKDPSFLRQLLAVQKRMIAEHYGRLLDGLHLAPADRERFIALLAEKQLEKTEAESTAVEMGALGTGLVIPAITAAQQGVNGQIEQLLGPERYQAYYDFEMTDGLRTTLKRLQESLRYTGEPLPDATLESLVTVFDQATPPDQRGGIAKFTGMTAEVATGLVQPPFSAPLPPEAPQLAQSILSPFQRQQLAELMRQQQDELELRSESIAAARAASAGTP